MNTTTPNDLDTTRCGTCGEAAWFDATCTGWTHDDPERDAHPVAPEEARTPQIGIPDRTEADGTVEVDYLPACQDFTVGERAVATDGTAYEVASIRPVQDYVTVAFRPVESPTLIVRASRILGTDTVALSVWEPSTYTGPHSTVSTLSLGRGCWGLLTSRRCERADAMPPGSEERRTAYEGWRAAVQAKAVRVIVDTLGEIGEPSRIWRGEVHTTVADLDAAGWSSILDAPARAVVGR